MSRKPQSLIERLEDRKMMAVFTIDSLQDNTIAADNQTTFREAVVAAAANPGADILRFDSSLTQSGPARIELTQGSIEVNSDVTIEGAGRDLLTIDAQGNSRVFMVNAGVNATISDMAITGGNSDSGGGISTFGNLTLNSVNVADNTSSDKGGGIFVFGTLDRQQRGHCPR
jgi:hypothetical protein